jgi:hypothetical protein
VLYFFNLGNTFLNKMCCNFDCGHASCPCYHCMEQHDVLIPASLYPLINLTAKLESVLFHWTCTWGMTYCAVLIYCTAWSALFWDFTQRRTVTPRRRFGTTYWYHVQESSSPRSRILLLCCTKSQKNVDLICIATDAWNHILYTNPLPT